MNKRRIFAVLMMTMILALFITGCTSSDQLDDNNSEESEALSIVEEAAEEPDSEVLPAGLLKETIENYFSSGDDTYPYMQLTGIESISEKYDDDSYVGTVVIHTESENAGYRGKVFVYFEYDGKDWEFTKADVRLSDWSISEILFYPDTEEVEAIIYEAESARVNEGTRGKGFENFELGKITYDGDEIICTCYLDEQYNDAVTLTGYFTATVKLCYSDDSEGWECKNDEEHIYCDITGLENLTITDSDGNEAIISNTTEYGSYFEYPYFETGAFHVSVNSEYVSRNTIHKKFDGRNVDFTYKGERYEDQDVDIEIESEYGGKTEITVEFHLGSVSHKVVFSVE